MVWIKKPFHVRHFSVPWAPGAANPRPSLFLPTSKTPRAKPQIGSACPGQPKDHSGLSLQLSRTYTRQVPHLALNDVLNPRPCSSWEDERPGDGVP